MKNVNSSQKKGTITQKPKNNEQEKLKNRPKKTRKATNENNYEQLQENDSFFEEEEDFADDASQNNNDGIKKIIILGVVTVVIVTFLVVGFIVMRTLNNDNDVDGTTGAVTESTTSLDEDDEDDLETDSSEFSTQESFETGDSYLEGEKYEEGVLTETTPEYYSSTDFLKDLNGYEIPAVYTVQNVTYDVAHVNYQSKRATIDDGMEFYWVEIDYNGKRYRAQCSYNMFRQLESEGICKVALEILTLDTGQQVISYMKVVPEEYTVEDAENDYNF